MNAPCKMSVSEEGEQRVVVHYQNQRASSPEPSCVSLKSEESIGQPPNLCDGAVTFNPR